MSMLQCINCGCPRHTAVVHQSQTVNHSISITQQFSPVWTADPHKDVASERTVILMTTWLSTKSIGVTSYGARAPSTSNCLIFLQVTSEPHKLFDIRLRMVASTVKIYRPIALLQFVGMNVTIIFVCHPKIIFP